MLPSFLVVGAKRSGSTSLYHWITAHPDVVPCRAEKGTHFFDVNYGRGMRWFRSCFAPPRHDHQITGEASPYYMFHPLAAGRIAAALPDARLIAVLRDPVSRAWSHYQYEVATGHETLPFAAALDREDERLAGEEERMIAEPGYESHAHRHHSYLHRGHYAAQLERLLELFPADRLLVLQSERLFADPQRELRRVWRFLGLPGARPEGLRVHKAGQYEGMPPATCERLRDYYRPHLDRLYALPQVDFRWAEVGDP